MPSYTPVTAVLRGLEVLRVINRSGTSSVKDIHYETGLDKATIVRMLETLIHAGYLRRNEDTGAYAVTGRVRQLSSGFVGYDNAGAISAPILAGLRDEIGWPSGFTVCDGDAMVVIQTSRDIGPLSFARNPGYRIPMLTASVGKVYLAFCPEAERREIIAKLRASEDRTQQVSLGRIETMIKQVRKAQYAITDDTYSHREYKGRFQVMAVPVMDEDDIYGALNIIWLRNTLTPAQARDQYLSRMQATAQAIAEELRSSGSQVPNNDR